MIYYKEDIAILISLLFVLNTFGVTSTIASLSATAIHDTVKVGDIITVTTYNSASNYEVADANGNIVEGYAEKIFGPIGSTQLYTWTFRALKPDN